MNKPRIEKICGYGIWAGAFIILLTPFLVTNIFYYPFTFTKILVFRVAVEIIFLLYLCLLVLDYKRYQPKITFSIALVGIYTAYQFIAAIFGVNFYFSFWSNYERGIGLVLLIHLLAFLVVLAGFFREKRYWLALFDFFVAVSLLLDLFSLGQKLDIGIFLNTQGARLSSTIGNGAFLSAYLIFSLFFCVYLWSQRKNLKARIYYLAHAVLDVYIITQTATRGAALALLASAILLFIFSFLLFRKKLGSKIKKYIIAVFAFAVLFFVFIWLARESPLIKENPIWGRITDLSFQHKTIQTRFMSWNSGWQGIKDRPLFGYGLENFNIAFNKYFNPRLFESETSVVWFDRAHNIIIDQAVAGGIIGLTLYLFIFGYLFYFWHRRQKRNPDEVFVALIFLVMLSAYLIQNLFVFDTYNSFLAFFLFLGLVAFLERPICQFKVAPAISKSATIAFAIILLPLIYYVNIAPALANVKVVSAMKAGNIGNFEQSYALFNDALSYKTYGDNEIRLRFAEFMDGIILKNLADESYMRKAAVTVSRELEKQLSLEPKDVSNYLLLMRHYNYVGRFNSEYYYQSLDLYEKAIELSPTNPQIYIEAGITANYLAEYYSQNNIDLFEKFLRQANDYYKKAIDLAPLAVEPRVGILTTLMIAGQEQEVLNYLNLLDQELIDYHQYKNLKKIGNLAVGYNNYQVANKVFKEIIESGNFETILIIQDYINLALSYAFLGNSEKAIETAELVRSIYPENEANINEFIEQVKSGFYQN